MATITNNSDFVRANFRNSEVYSKCSDAPSSHYLDDVTLDALQTIRNWSGQPIRVTSTYRTNLCNQLAGGSEYSQHLQGKAIDFQWINNNAYWIEAFRNEMKCRGPLWLDLRAIGIGGFGFYDTFVHIDSRAGLAAWDYSTLYDNEFINSAFLTGDLPDYCGSFDSSNPTDLPSGGSKKKSWLTGLLNLFGPGEDKVAANIRPLTYLWITTLVIIVVALIWKTRK